MATTISKDDILQAVQAMTLEERLKLIAAIAELSEDTSRLSAQQTDASGEISNQEVKELTRQFTDKHGNLLRRLAQ
jgi:hypothetical protein